MKYTIGLDYGTLSGRAIIARCSDGEIMASAVKEYTHGVMDEVLCDSEWKLPDNWALEYPGDYIEVLETVIPEILEKSGVASSDIIGLGIDFTACTMLPIDKNAVPLCEKKQFKGRRNSYAKLWKHHGAQRCADKINKYLEQNRLDKSARFGGKVSSELLLPKVLEILEEDPEVYEAADEILEAGDWITRVLTNSHKRSCSMSGYKAWWNEKEGYPSGDFFENIDVRLSGFINDKLPGEVVGVGNKVGILSEEWAERLGLKPGIAVAPAIIDSHAGVPGSCVSNKEQIMLVLGTSSVMVGLSENPYSQNGIIGGVKNAIVPGYYALESGLASVGDLFGWFVDNMVPFSYEQEAGRKGISIHELLSEKAMTITPGKSGILVLDWWNGNKTPFVDGNLKGSIIGISLNTKPEEIYRALIEATAFGTKRILDLYEENGINVKEIICSGGIVLKNPLLMQIYADVLGKKLKVAASDQAAALGTAIYAALSAGKNAGGYDSYEDAVIHMSKVEDKQYLPDTTNNNVYNSLYTLYKDFGEIMGSERRQLLERLEQLRRVGNERWD